MSNKKVNASKKQATRLPTVVEAPEPIKEHSDTKRSLAKPFLGIHFDIKGSKIAVFVVSGIHIVLACLIFTVWCLGLAGTIPEWKWAFQCLLMGYGEETDDVHAWWPFFFMVAIGWIFNAFCGSMAMNAPRRMSVSHTKLTILFLIVLMAFYTILLVFAVFRKGALSSTNELDFESWQDGHTKDDASHKFGYFLLTFGLLVPFESICLFVCFHFLGKLKTVTHAADQVKEIEIAFQNTNKRLQAAEKKAAKAERLAAKEAAAAHAAHLQLQRQASAPVSNTQNTNSLFLNRAATYDADLSTADAYRQADALAAIPTAPSWGKESFASHTTGHTVATSAAAFGSRPASEYAFTGHLAALVAPSERSSACWDGSERASPQSPDDGLVAASAPPLSSCATSRTSMRHASAPPLIITPRASSVIASSVEPSAPPLMITPRCSSVVESPNALEASAPPLSQVASPATTVTVEKVDQTADAVEDCENIVQQDSVGTLDGQISPQSSAEGGDAVVEGRESIVQAFKPTVRDVQPNIGHI